MSGDCLRGYYPQPTPLAPAQVWPGLDLGFLVDFLRPRVCENQRGLTNRADGRQDHH